jgi:uncharacterized protein YuzE
MNPDFNQLCVPAPKGGKLTIEIDDSSHSVYIRFKTAKIHKTLSDHRDSRILAIDVDSRGDIIGIELVGIQNFSIPQIRRRLPERFKKIDFDQAQWMSAASCRSDLVPA